MVDQLLVDRERGFYPELGELLGEFPHCKYYEVIRGSGAYIYSSPVDLSQFKVSNLVFLKICFPLHVVYSLAGGPTNTVAVVNTATNSVVQVSGGTVVENLNSAAYIFMMKFCDKPYMAMILSVLRLEKKDKLEKISIKFFEGGHNGKSVCQLGASEGLVGIINNRYMEKKKMKKKGAVDNVLRELSKSEIVKESVVKNRTTVVEEVEEEPVNTVVGSPADEVILEAVCEESCDNKIETDSDRIAASIKKMMLELRVMGEKRYDEMFGIDQVKKVTNDNYNVDYITSHSGVDDLNPSGLKVWIHADVHRIKKEMRPNIVRDDLSRFDMFQQKFKDLFGAQTEWFYEVLTTQVLCILKRFYSMSFEHFDVCVNENKNKNVRISRNELMLFLPGLKGLELKTDLVYVKFIGVNVEKTRVRNKKSHKFCVKVDPLKLNYRRIKHDLELFEVMMASENFKYKTPLWNLMSSLKKQLVNTKYHGCEPLLSIVSLHTLFCIVPFVGKLDEFCDLVIDVQYCGNVDTCVLRSRWLDISMDTAEGGFGLNYGFLVKLPRGGVKDQTIMDKLSFFNYHHPVDSNYQFDPVIDLFTLSLCK